VNDPKDDRLDIDVLKERHERLKEKRIAAQTELATATKRLNELREQARAQFGTDDVNALQKKLEEMKEENERKRAAYQAHLEQIERQLQEIEAAQEQRAPASEDEDT
jgi:hypothetical protein